MPLMFDLCIEPKLMATPLSRHEKLEQFSVDELANGVVVWCAQLFAGFRSCSDARRKFSCTTNKFHLGCCQYDFLAAFG